MRQQQLPEFRPPSPSAAAPAPAQQPYRSLTRYEDVHIYRDRMHRERSKEHRSRECHPGRQADGDLRYSLPHAEAQYHSKSEQYHPESERYHPKDGAYAAFLAEIGPNIISRSGVKPLGKKPAESCRDQEKASHSKYLRNVDLLESEFPDPMRAERKYFKLDVVEPAIPRLYESMAKCTNDVDSVNSFKSDATKAKKTTPTHYVDMARTLKELTAKDKVVSHSSKEALLDKEKALDRGPRDNTNRAADKRGEKMTRRHTTEYRGPPHLVLPPVKNDSSDSAERSPVAVRNSKNPYPYVVLTEQRLTKKKNSVTSSTSEENSDLINAAIKLRMQAKDWRENKAPKRIDSLTVDRRSSKKHAAKSSKMKRQGSFNIDPAGEFHLSLDVGRGKDMSCSVRSCAKSPLMDARKTPSQISAEDMVQIANCGARNKNGSLCHFISTNDNYLSISQAILNRAENEPKAADDDTLSRKVRTSERKKKSTHSLALESSDETLCDRDKYTPKDRREDKAPAKRREDTKMGKGHTRQRSHDLDKSAKYRQESAPGRKLLHSKSEQRTRAPAGYFLLEDAGDCLGSLNKSDLSSDAEHLFRRLGGSSREELTASGGDVEESFDF